MQEPAVPGNDLRYIFGDAMVGVMNRVDEFLDYQISGEGKTDNNTYTLENSSSNINIDKMYVYFQETISSENNF